MDISDAVQHVMRFAGKRPDVQEIEAYASRNVVTVVRMETLRHGKLKIGPAPMQMMTIENIGASVRVVHDKAMGMAVTSYLTKEALDRAVEAALANAKRMDPDPNFFSLAKPVGRAGGQLDFDREIASGEYQDRLSDEVEKATAMVDEPDIDLAGKLMLVSESFSIENSNGIGVDENIDTFAVAQLTAERVQGAEVISSGVGWDSSRLLERLNSGIAAADAVQDAKATPVHKTIPEGEYNVILGQYAVADVIDNMLAGAFSLGSVYMGFSWAPTERGKLESGQEGLLPKLGSQVASESLTFKDEPLLDDGMASKAFDDEGLPTRENTIIEKGLWKAALGDSYYAYLYGREPSGNGFRTGEIPGRCAGAGPSGVGTNMSIEPGDMTLEEMVEASKGPTLLLPRTWYTYPTRYGASTFSSSNRSTSYLVENGELVPVAPNAFKLIGDVRSVLMDIYGIGKERKVATTWAAEQASIVPMIATKGLRVEKADF